MTDFKPGDLLELLGPDLTLRCYAIFEGMLTPTYHHFPIGVSACRNPDEDKWEIIPGAWENGDRVRLMPDGPERDRIWADYCAALLLGGSN